MKHTIDHGNIYEVFEHNKARPWVKWGLAILVQVWTVDGGVWGGLEKVVVGPMVVAKVVDERGEVIVVASALFWTLFAILWSFVTKRGVDMDGSEMMAGDDAKEEW